MPLTKEGAKLILKGVDILGRIKDDEFDMGGWRTSVLTVSGCDEKVNECKTTCCLLGWMMSVPEAEKAGVVFTVNDWAVKHQTLGEAQSLNDIRTGKKVMPSATYKYEFTTTGRRPRVIDADEAIKKLTGLDVCLEEDDDLINELFYDDDTRREVIKRTPDLIEPHFPKLVAAWRRKNAAKRKTKKS